MARITHKFLIAAVLILIFTAGFYPQDSGQDITKILIAGDSTVHNSGKLTGWGDVIENYFDLTKARVINYAKPGRSSRSFRNEGLWKKLLDEIKTGDWVFIQFGHNDSAAIEEKKYAGRGDLQGTGGRFVRTKNTPDNKYEFVHTFGWYMTKCVKEAKARGANVVIFSPVPREYWTDNYFSRVMKIYTPWCTEVADRNGVYFVDLENLVSECYIKMGKEKTAQFYPQDNTHTNTEGANFIAGCAIEGLKSLNNPRLNSLIKKQEQLQK